MLGGILREALASKPEAFTSPVAPPPPAAKEAVTEAATEAAKEAATEVATEEATEAATEAATDLTADDDDPMAADDAEPTAAAAAAAAPGADGHCGRGAQADGPRGRCGGQCRGGQYLLEDALAAAASSALSDAEAQVPEELQAKAPWGGSMGQVPEELQAKAPSEQDEDTRARAELLPRLLHGLHASFGARTQDEWSLREALDALGAAEGCDLRAAGHKWLVKLAARHYLLIDKHTRTGGGALAGGPPAVPPTRSISADLTSRESVGGHWGRLV